jgi:biotin operon repressor
LSEILFGVSDAAGIRFCVSPLWETVRSRYVLADTEGSPVHLPWRREARELTVAPAAAHGVALLAELTRPRAYFPDFLTPAPAGPLGDFEAELATVAATPLDVVVADLRSTTARLPLGPLAAAGLTDPATLLADLVTGVREWHRVAVAPYWTRIRGLLEADIAYRARRLAEGGVRRLIDTLHPEVRWAGDRIVADDPFGISLDLRGRGLALVPSIFVTCHVLWTVRPESPPFAAYPAQARGAVWERQPPADAALAALFGASRARMLDMLRQPATTSELSRRLGMSAGAVSEHLQVLHAAGLLARSRHGRTVLYVATAAGHTLLDAGAA